jgi:hypothetical protein
MIDLKALAEDFPKSAVSWRSQSLTKDGKKAMALAYIDARDVMDRLDTICGPANWQDRYEFHGSRTVCYLSIRIDEEWITKADGAGDSDVEAEKGAISDALKRAAVKWGIGRYLYAMPTPWVPCESYDKNGKLYWSKWTADPWSFVRGGDAPLQTPPANDPPAEVVRLKAGDGADKLYARLVQQLNEAAMVNIATLGKVWADNKTDIKRLPEPRELDLIDLKEALKAKAIAAA